MHTHTMACSSLRERQLCRPPLAVNPVWRFIALAAAAVMVAEKGLGRCLVGIATHRHFARPHTWQSAVTARHAQKVVRCPGCGQAQRADCDGNGHLVGFNAEWSPVKAYRPCPRFKGTYQSKGSSFTDIFEASVEKMDDKMILEVPATWRSLTKIRLREYPDLTSSPTGDFVGPYESFKVDDVIRKDGQHYLKLAGKTGWAFDRGIAGAWKGKPICERLDL
eukprot:TRINITY_DN109394_c0_g1_i1.p1 TRINITY_DN109394_c0_g1~~TRINITY_DN109394_c0_g1_i1.p1  ORF type:complete len:221 (+),score=39.43 TRINITY_DN109394_c0_g1_i1:11-673(+)